MHDLFTLSHLIHAHTRLLPLIPLTAFTKALTDQVFLGDMDGGIKFDGAHNSVQVPDSSSLDITGNMTIECFFNMLTTPAAVGEIFKKNLQYILRVNSSNKLEGDLWTTVSGLKSISFSPMPLGGGIHHAAISWDGTTFRLFLDGSMVASLAMSGTISTGTTPIGIGAQNGNNAEFFNGIINEVRVSNIARYTGSYTIPDAPLGKDANTVGLWHFNEGSGTSALDSSGNNNTGTLTGSPLPTWITGFNKSVAKFPTDSISLVESIQKATVRFLTDSVSLSESVLKAIGKSFIDSVSLSDSLSKGIARALSDSVSLTDSLLREIVKVYVDSISLVEQLIRATSRFVTDSLSLSDILAVVTHYVMTLTDSVSLVESILKATGKKLSDSISLTVVFGAFRNYAMTLTDSVVHVETLGKSMVRSFFDIVQFIERLRRKSKWFKSQKPQPSQSMPASISSPTHTNWAKTNRAAGGQRAPSVISSPAHNNWTRGKRPT